LVRLGFGLLGLEIVNHRVKGKDKRNTWRSPKGEAQKPKRNSDETKTQL
jgi:hypothetical protein